MEGGGLQLTRLPLVLVRPTQLCQLCGCTQAQDQRFCRWQSSQPAHVVWGNVTLPGWELCCSLKEYHNTTLILMIPK